MDGHDFLDLAAAEREQLQFERLQSTLNRAYRNVPFHQKRQNELAAASGRDPSLLDSLADIDSLPFMERQDLGEHYPYGLFAVPLKDIVRIHTAPGTTFNPTVSGYTCNDLAAWRSMMARGLGAAGLTSQDILQISLDTGLNNWGRDYKEGGETLAVGVIPHTSLSAEKQLMVLRDYKTSVLVTTPTQATHLAGHLFRADLNPTALNLKRIILVGEPVARQFRVDLETQLHTETWVHFGLSELPGPAIAFECGLHQGLHIQEDHFLAEIIAPDSGRPLPPGEAGELVLTTLTARAFPLIRFRTGERARLLEAPCPCGRPLKRIEWLEKRTDALLNLNGVRVNPQLIQAHLSRQLGFSPRCIHTVRRPPLEAPFLEVEIAVEERLFSDEIKVLEQRIRAIRLMLRENLGVPVNVVLGEGGKRG